MKYIETTQFYKLLKSRESIFLPSIDEVINICNDTLSKINFIFPNYTNHDIEHSSNILDYMYSLCKNPDELNELEITVLIYCSLLHDIGMVANQDEVSDIKSSKSLDNGWKFSAMKEYYKSDELALQTYIRINHHIRSREFILNNINDSLFKIPQTSYLFNSEVAKICEAHGENFEWIEKNLERHEKIGNFSINLQFCAILLRLSDYLDIDSSRSPHYLFNYLSLDEYSQKEWIKNFTIQNSSENKIEIDPLTNLKQISMYGKVSDPSVHRKLLKYFSDIEKEIDCASILSKRFSESKYHILVNSRIIDNIKTEGFNVSNYKLDLNYSAVTNLLMGEHIYGNRKYGLRELIQNSIDACKLMEIEALQFEKYKNLDYEPFIIIDINVDENEVRLTDNGRGMSLEILKKHFFNTGVSYYKSNDYLFNDYSYTPIGNYGIGFLSCFMMSDSVKVNTKYYKENMENIIEFKKNDEFFSLAFRDSQRLHGTDIILKYDQFKKVFKDINEIKRFIIDNFLDNGVKIKLTYHENGERKKYPLELLKISENNDLIKLLEKITIYDISDFYRNSKKDYVNISKFLDGVEAYINFSFNKNGFKNKLYDLENGDFHRVDPEKNNLVLIDDEYISKFIINGEVKYLSIAVINEKNIDEFLKYYDVLDDFNNALDRIMFEEIDIIVEDFPIESANTLIESNNLIYRNYSFDDFEEQFNHSYECTRINLHSRKVITNGGNEVLSYTQKDMTTQSSYKFNSRVYIRNILASNAELSLPFVLDGTYIKSIFINIENKDIYPEVSRNDINRLLLRDLSESIAFALHLWILENETLTDNQKNLIKKFLIEKFTNSRFIKNEFKM